MRDGSVLTTDWNDRVWRAWPDGKTVLINDPYFVQKRMDFYEGDKDHPDAKLYRSVDFATNFFITALVGITVVLIGAAIIS